MGKSELFSHFADRFEMKRTQAREYFDELTALESSQRDGKADPEHYANRRRELVTALERVYAALDDEVAVSRAS